MKVSVVMLIIYILIIKDGSAKTVSGEQIMIILSETCLGVSNFETLFAINPGLRFALPLRHGHQILSDVAKVCNAFNDGFLSAFKCNCFV